MSSDEKITAAKLQFNEVLGQFNIEEKKRPQDPEAVKDKYQKLVAAYSNLLDTINRCIASDHEGENLYRDKAFREDHEATVANFLQTMGLFWKVVDGLVKEQTISAPVFSSNSYDTIERFIGTFMEDQVQEYKSQLSQRGIATTAFAEKFEDFKTVEEKEKEEQQAKEDARKQKISIIVGGACVLISLALWIFKGKIDPQASLALKVLFSLGIGGLSAALLGFITVSTKSENPFAISAGGGFAVFLLLLYLGPLKIAPSRPSIFQVTIFFDHHGEPQSPDNFNEFRMTAGGSVFTADAVSNDRYVFSNISDQFRDTAAIFRFKSPKWVFDSSKTTSFETKLNKMVYHFPVVMNAGSLVLKGYLKQGTAPLVAAVISLRDSLKIADTTREGGYFSLTVPEALARKQVPVVIKKDGVYWLDSLEMGVEKPVFIPLPPRVPPPPNRNAGPSSTAFLDGLILLLETSRRQYNMYQLDKRTADNIRSLYQGNVKLLAYLQKPANARQVYQYKLEGHLGQLEVHLQHWIEAYRSQEGKAGWPDNSGKYIVNYDDARYGFPDGITEVLRTLKDRAINNS